MQSPPLLNGQICKVSATLCHISVTILHNVCNSFIHICSISAIMFAYIWQICWNFFQISAKYLWKCDKCRWTKSELEIEDPSFVIICQSWYLKFPLRGDDIWPNANQINIECPNNCTFKQIILQTLYMTANGEGSQKWQEPVTLWQQCGLCSKKYCMWP